MSGRSAGRGGRRAEATDRRGFFLVSSGASRPCVSSAPASDRAGRERLRDEDDEASTNAGGPALGVRSPPLGVARPLPLTSLDDGVAFDSRASEKVLTAHPDGLFGPAVEGRLPSRPLPPARSLGVAADCVQAREKQKRQ